MKIDTEKWLPLGLAAQYAGVSRQAVIDWYAANILTAISPWNTDNGRYYSVDDLDKIIDNRKHLTHSK